jgi:hypothetical protein
MYLLKLEQILEASTLVLATVKWDPFNRVVCDREPALLYVQKLIHTEGLDALLKIEKLLKEEELRSIDIRAAVKVLLAEAIK